MSKTWIDCDSTNDRKSSRCHCIQFGYPNGQHTFSNCVLTRQVLWQTYREFSIAIGHPLGVCENFRLYVVLTYLAIWTGRSLLFLNSVVDLIGSLLTWLTDLDQTHYRIAHQILRVLSSFLFLVGDGALPCVSCDLCMDLHWQRGQGFCRFYSCCCTARCLYREPPVVA